MLVKQHTCLYTQVVTMPCYTKLTILSSLLLWLIHDEVVKIHML